MNRHSNLAVDAQLSAARQQREDKAKRHLRMLYDPDPDKRLAAIESLSALFMDAVPTVVLKGLMDCLNDEAVVVRCAAVDALGQSGAAVAVPEILTLLRCSVWQVRQASALALGQLGSEKVVPELLLALRSEELPEVRATIADALGMLGSPDAVSKLLEQVPIETDRDVRDSVLCSVAKLGSVETLRALEHIRMKNDIVGESVIEWAAARLRAKTALASDYVSNTIDHTGADATPECPNRADLEQALSTGQWTQSERLHASACEVCQRQLAAIWGGTPPTWWAVVCYAAGILQHRRAMDIYLTTSEAVHSRRFLGSRVCKVLAQVASTLPGSSYIADCFPLVQGPTVVKLRSTLYNRIGDGFVSYLTAADAVGARGKFHLSQTLDDASLLLTLFEADTDELIADVSGPAQKIGATIQLTLACDHDSLTGLATLEPTANGSRGRFSFGPFPRVVSRLGFDFLVFALCTTGTEQERSDMTNESPRLQAIRSASDTTGESGRGIVGLFVGVNDYPEHTGWQPLRYAVNDATALAAFFQQPTAIGYDAARIQVLENPTHGELTGAVHRLTTGAAKGDVLMFGFFGHGLDSSGKSYLYPRDAPKALSASAIPVDWLWGMLDKSESRVKLLFIDACHSGSLGERGSSSFGSSIADLGKSQGWAVLSACRRDQLSYEHDDLKHGIFTHTLLQGLKGDADSNADGVITVDDLFRFASVHTPQLAVEKFGADQNPERFDNVDGDIPLVTIQKSATPVLAVAGAKGGVGKGTFVSCVAQLIADKGHDVAIVDFDLQTSGSTLEALHVHTSLPLVKTVFDHFAQYTDRHRRASPHRSEKLWNITPEHLRAGNRGNIWLLPANEVERTRHGWDVTADILPVSTLDGVNITRSQLLRHETERILARVRKEVPRASVILFDCGAGKAAEHSAAFRCASYRFLITLPDSSFFPELYSLRNLQVERYPDDDLSNLYTVTNRVTGPGDRLRCQNLNPQPIAYIPRDPVVEEDRYAGGAIDYDLGYNHVFRAVREGLARTVGQDFPDLIPNEFEARVKPWWTQLVELGLARKTVTSLRFRLMTYGLCAAVAGLAMALVIFTWRLLRDLFATSSTGAVGGDLAITAAVLCAVSVAMVYFIPHAMKRRLLLKISKLQPGASEQQAEVLATLLKELLDEPDRSKLRWLEDLVKNAIKREKIKRTVGRSDSWWVESLDKKSR
jgi:MinD-like ATPase involved in chromosome partitioning or flagellar assembly